MTAGLAAPRLQAIAGGRAPTPTAAGEPALRSLGAPGYGLTDEYRWRAVGAARLFGVTYAAREYRVARSTVYRWLRRAAHE